MHDVFERFVIEDWKGIIRGQHRYFSAATRRSSQWIPADEAEKMARTAGRRITDFVRHGQIEGMFLSVRRSGGHTECWIKRDSLQRWMAARDVELARYMPRSEVERTLGLTKGTIVKLAGAGAIRYVQGPEQNFPSGSFFFLREDVMKIMRAFEKLAVPQKEYLKPGELIALRHAMKNYLGRSSGFASVIRAVVDGDLAPVGYTDRFRGITGYLFPSEDLRKYRPVVGIKALPEGFLNYREAAALLGVRTPVIRGLVAQELLGAPAGYRNGLSKLVPAADLRCFAEHYVATTVLAKRFNLNGRSFSRHLKESGTPLLTVPIPEEGRRPALFALRNSDMRSNSLSRNILPLRARLKPRLMGKMPGQRTQRVR